MKISVIQVAAASLILCVSSAVSLAASAPDPSWKKASDNKIYAQSLVNDALRDHPELVVIGVHANLPGTKDERMIASNLDRIGKVDDDDDRAGAVDGKTVLAPNPAEPDKFEILMPLHDKGGDIVGAIAFVFKYQKGDDQVKLLAQATAIRDAFAEKIAGADDLFRAAELK